MEKKFPIFKILTLLVWLVLGMGTAFADGDCLETATVWKDCVSAPSDTTIDAVTYKKITTEKELAWLSNNYANNAILLKDLDMGGKLWIPIAAGDGTNKYSGIFDGNNHRISNLYVNAEDFINNNNKTYAQNLGFIGCLTGTVKNLIIENISVYGYGSGFLKDKVDTEEKPLSIGTVVGWQSGNNSVVEGCYVTGKIITSGDGQAVGGVVGNIGGGTIKNCVSYASIDANGKAYVGGIVGYAKNFQNTGKDIITSCVYAGNSLSSTGSGAVGGIVGYQYKGNVTISDVVYDSDLSNDGEPINGFGATKEGKVNGTSSPDLDFLGAQTSSQTELNDEDIVHALNGKNDDGTWKTEPWEMGATALSLNGYGVDGYKITFDANGGSFSGGSMTFVKYVKADYIINNDGVENPSWDDDHAFAGWTSETTPEAYMNPANGVVTIKAIWNPVYTITFTPVNGNLNGSFPDGSTAPKTVKVEQGKQISVQGFDRPTSFEQWDESEQKNVKYNFVGWANAVNPDPDNIENYDSNNPEFAYVKNGLDDLPVATGNMTLVAVWTTADVWTVSFFADNASAASYVGSVYANDKATPWVVEYTGYTFDAWYEKNDDGTFKDEPFNFETEITQNYELHAKWEKDSYNITYVMNCSDKCVNSNAVQYTVDGLSLSNPTWDDAHLFKGWSTDAEFKNKVTEIDAGKTGDLTLYAEWETIVYEITYRAGENGTGFVDPEYKTHGVDYTIRGASYTRKGAIQNGWRSSNEVHYGLDGATYTVDAPLVLYPTWELFPYTISYTCDLCDISDETVYPRLYNVESSFGLPFPNVADGYVFVGWYKDNKYKNKINNVQAGSTGNLNLYGKVLEQYTITYVGTDNSYGDKTYTVESGAQLRTAAPREGYTFAGWFDNPDFEGDAVTQVPQGSTGDKTFYAKWNKVYPFVAHYGPAITVTEYEDGTKTAVVNGDYGDKDKGNEHGLAVEILNDIPVNSVVMTREFPTGLVEYSTFVLPFDVSSANVSNVRAVLRYNGIKSGSTISMKVVWAADGVIQDAKGNNVHYGDSTLKANTPYLVLMDQDSDGKFVVNGGVTLKKTTIAETTADGWTFRGTWQYKMWGAKGTDPETGNAYGFSASKSTANNIDVGTFVKVGEGAWIRPMRAYLVKAGISQIRANGAYVKRPTVKPEELPEIMSVVIDGIGDGNETTVIGQFNTRTGEFKMNYDRGKFDLKGRRVNGSNNARGAYYGKKILKK